VDIYDSFIKTLQSGYFCSQMLHVCKVRYISRVPMHFLVSFNHSLPTYFSLVLSYQFSLFVRYILLNVRYHRLLFSGVEAFGPSFATDADPFLVSESGFLRLNMHVP
jgi:hypothetical protein